MIQTLICSGLVPAPSIFLTILHLPGGMRNLQCLCFYSPWSCGASPGKNLPVMGILLTICIHPRGAVGRRTRSIFPCYMLQSPCYMRQISLLYARNPPERPFLIIGFLLTIWHSVAFFADAVYKENYSGE